MLVDATESMRKDMSRILSWMIYGKGLLRRVEILSAASVHMENLDFGDDCRLQYGILERCKPLVEEGQNGTVRLIHFTVREYVIALLVHTARKG
jgi:hypothetical protein